MPTVLLVTYMRNGEQFTLELEDIADMLFNLFGQSFEVNLCCEADIEIKTQKPYPIKQRLYEGTKYQRLLSLMKNDDSDFYFSIDNDIRGDIDHMREFVKVCAKDSIDIAWGKIRARNHKGLVSGLVAVDKLLSHNILRPLLWWLGVGITIPGQCFWIKREAFVGHLPEIDTFLDDLAVGLNVSNRLKSLKIKISSFVLGYEIPNETFMGLFNQRKRWAMGYVSVLKGSPSTSDRVKVVIHGIAYHLLWVVSLSVCFYLARLNWVYALAYLGVMSFIIGGRKIGYAFLYQLVFPIFHICWVVTVLLGRGDK